MLSNLPKVAQLIGNIAEIQNQIDVCFNDCISVIVRHYGKHLVFFGWYFPIATGKKTELQRSKTIHSESPGL